MRHVITTILILMCGVVFVGCEGKPGSDKDTSKTEINVSEPGMVEPNETSSSKSPLRHDSDPFEIEGTVVRKNIEGGFYAINGEDGKKYNPINLPESFRKDGLKVKLTARLRMDTMSIHMYGAMIEVTEIAAN